MFVAEYVNNTPAFLFSILISQMTFNDMTIVMKVKNVMYLNDL